MTTTFNASAPRPSAGSRTARNRRRSNSLRPAAEALEGRAMLAANLIPVSGFGTGGVVALSDLQNPITAAAAQPDGKVVAVGALLGGQFFAERFNADGSLDESFGAGGIAQVQINIGGIVQETPQAVAVQPDGKVVIVGYAAAPSQGTTVNGAPSGLTATRTVLAAARLNANGSPDTTFGGGGSTTVDFAAPGVLLSTVTTVRDSDDSVLIQPGGKILVGGGEYVGGIGIGGSSESPIIARFNADGSLDPTFGAGGKALPGATGGTPSALSQIGAFTSLGLEPDGRIVVAGETYHSIPGTIAPVVERLNADGSNDATFGTNGYVLASGSRVAVQADGKIVVGGDPVAGAVFDSKAVTRLNLGGSPDTTFGSGGRVNLSFLGAPSIGPDGTITVVGTGTQADPVALMSVDSTVNEARLEPDGTFDPTLGSGGVSAVTAAGGGLAPLALVVRPTDGSIVEFGHLTNSTLSVPYTAAAFVAVASAPTVLSLTAGRDRRGLESIAIAFVGPVAQAGASNPADYSVRLLNRRGRAVSTARIARASFNATTNVATITLRRPISNAYSVRVSASGKSIVGVDGLKLAGDGTNPGSDYVGVIAKPAKAARRTSKA